MAPSGALFQRGENMDAREYVEWFHNKFKISYSYNYFPTMKMDHAVLITMIEAFNIKTVCEIGTWKGDTALLLWLHPNIQRVKCIDVHKDMELNGTPYSHNAHVLMDKSEYGSMFKNTPIELVFADTMTYPRGCEQHDLVFIDGNHDYEHIVNDTELAKSWCPKVIVWHDYGGGNDDVVKFLNKIKTEKFMQFPGSLCVAVRAEELK